MICVLILVFLLLFLVWSSYSRVCFWTDLDEEVCHLGHWMCRVFEGY
jgi:hypothetical protein